MTAGTSPATRELVVTPVTGTIGAELSGVILAEDAQRSRRSPTFAPRSSRTGSCSSATSRSTTRRQVAFAQRLGTLTLGHPTIESPPDQPLMEEVDSAKGAPAADWHTDVTFLDQPVTFTCLRSVVLPEVGGDTMWANTVNVYDTLSPEFRELADTSPRHSHERAEGRAHRRRPFESRRGSRAASSSCRRSTAPSTPR